MKKLIKLITCTATLFAAIITTSNAQNWGFSLPYGGGGFAINGKNWTAGYGGAVAGGGRGGWGFQLPNGAGFYNGSGGGYVGGGYGGNCGGAVVTPLAPRIYYPSTRPIYVNPAGPAVIYSPVPMMVSGNPNYPRGVIVRRTPPAPFGQVSYPNVW